MKDTPLRLRHHFSAPMLGCLLVTRLVLPDRAFAEVSEFSTVQTDYSLEDGANKVRVSWLESDASAPSVDILVNGAESAHVDGGGGRKEVTVAAPDTGANLFEARAEGLIVAQVFQNVLEDQPMGDALELNVTCKGGDGEECEITVVFTNPGPPADAFRVSVDGQEAVQVSGGVGDKEAHVAASGSGERCVTVESTLKLEDGAYASDVSKACCDLLCKPRVLNRFIRGVCDGTSTSPDISTVVFGLRHLFLGRSAPCREACDANEDQRVDLGDMVYVLQYLFQGGPAPDSWKDQNGDGRKDPTCESIEEGRCGASHESCPS